MKKILPAVPRTRLAFLLAASLLAGDLHALGGGDDRRSQQPQPVQEPQRVETIGELKPRTPEEAARAEFFGFPGIKKITGRESISMGWHADPNMPQPGSARARELASPLVAGRVRADICRSNVVVIGQVTSARALLNKQETFLFTDFTISIDEALRPLPNAKTGTLIASRLGGVVILGGKRISTSTSAEMPRLQTRYLFFLNAMPMGEGFFFFPEPIELLGGRATQGKAAVHPAIDEVRKTLAGC